MKRFFLFLLLFMPCIAQGAARDFDTHAFAQIPVLADGRIKPLDSFARVMLTRIHGDDAYENLSPSQWLAFLFFNSAEAMKARMFIIHSTRAADVLGLPSNPDHYYSFEDIAAVLPTRSSFIERLMAVDKSTYTPEQAEIARVYSATNDFAELMGTFTLLEPLVGADDAMRARLHIASGAPVTLFDLHKEQQSLTAAFAEVLKSKGKSVESYAPEERSLARLTSRLILQEQLDGDNSLVRIIPPSWGGDEWLAPWAVLKSSGGSPKSAMLFADWRTLIAAYQNGDMPGWNGASQKLLRESQGAIEPSYGWRLAAEYYYHVLALLPMAAVFYGLGLGLIAGGLGAKSSRTLKAGKLFLFLGLLLQTAAIAMRMFILMRPPVSTLYESQLFVSFLVMAVSAWLGHKERIAAMVVGAATGLLLLLASWVFAGDNDTLGVLVAVLNTNFWLGTHVVCITTGYGCSLVAGAIAHLYLYRRAVQRLSETELESLGRLLHLTAVIALCFTTIGTMLGGIWADQSWGRFWGWDPKENGALLIVLWLIWLLHGRVAKQLSAFSFAACMALINVVVAVAWIGVNLLSVGLHSYGFTDTAANGLIGFCAIEFAYVAAMVVMKRFTVSSSAL